MLSPELEQILQQLYREARKAHYEFISLEHLLLVLIEEDASVPNVLKLCGADLKVVSEQLAASVAENTPQIPDHLLDTVETQPTLGFQRVIQRAMVHTQSAGKGLVEPLDVLDFHNIAAKSYFIMSDSGGVQEEAPSLGKPVLVLRDTTERPEGVEAGTLKLVGTETQAVAEAMEALLTDESLYQEMAQASNPYGDGKASERIAQAIAHYFKQTARPEEFKTGVKNV